jgi:ATP/maltotriose-dependent transcriptional regulator MalT
VAFPAVTCPARIAPDVILMDLPVKTHLLRVFAKLGVSDRTSAVLLAMELGLVGRATT